jgi:type VII secretion protein EccB
VQTQRDHVHAHQFMVGRMSTALVFGDPGIAEPPARRALVGLLAGVLLSALVTVACGVYGWLVPGGSTAWRKAGAVIVEKETGTRYVYVAGTLRPTPNFASALLVQGPKASVVSASRASLRGVPRGPAIGIAGAPQTLPAAGDLVAGPWLACLPATGHRGSGQGVNFDPEAPAEPLADDRFLLTAGENAEYLVWNGAKHRILDATVPAALGVTGVQPVPASADWLAAVPDAAELGVARIDGAGDEGPTVGGVRHRIGQLFRQRIDGGTADRMFVLRGDGLAPLDRIEAMLLEARAGTGQPVELTTAALAGAPQSPDRSLVGRLPRIDTARGQEPGDRVVCQRQRPVGEAIEVTVVLVAHRDAASGRDGHVGTSVRPGSGLVVHAVPAAAGEHAPELHLIADDGVQYPLSDDAALRALGLDRSASIPFPRSLLRELPVGPVLSRAAAIAGKEG